MAANDNEFELVLGHKLLLSIFFVMVVLFGLFFSFGYSVGYDRGQTEKESAVATVQPMEQSGDSVRLPDALLKDAPEVPPGPAAVPDAQATKTAGEPAGGSAPRADPVPVGRTAATPERTAAAVSDKPRPFRESKPPEPAPARRAPASPSVSGAAVARSIHLQVAALRVRSDAEMLVGKLTAKGYPATLFEQDSDEWHRVLVGPFNSTDAAEEYQTKLKADGLDSILRKP